MDNESRSAIMILEAIGSINASLSEASIYFRRQAKGSEVVHLLECRTYTTGTLVEGYIDVELENDEGICWFLTLEWEQELWLIRSRVEKFDRSGRYILVEFPVRSALTLNACVEQLLQTNATLIDHAVNTDLSAV